MNPGRVVGIAGVLLLLVGTSPALAASPKGNLSLTLTGAILDSGSQSYYHTGGQLVSAFVLGQPVAPPNTVLHYSLQATINGLVVDGSAEFSLVATERNGTHLVVTGSAPIDGMMAAEQFPLGCPGTGPCNSAIPGVFTGVAEVEVQLCHGADDSGNCTDLLEESVPMLFESAFLNPFGGPIFMATSDDLVAIVATYSQSRVTWAGIQLGGIVSGSLAGSPVSGEFAMTVSATEDLRAGYELDHGTIAFSTNNAAVTAVGTFVGRSTIPAGEACPTEMGFPPGTCQITGFSSAGVFSQTNSLGGSVLGKYSTLWMAPAVAFDSMVTATVKS